MQMDNALHIGPDNVWLQVLQPAPDRARPMLFLDRDGVIVKEVDYLHRVADVQFHSPVVDTIRAARAAGWGVVIITNQAGIGRGRYGWADFAAVNTHILNWLDAQGAQVDAVLATPHHPDGKAPFQHPNHPMRKPNPGMILAAAAALRGLSRQSVIVGDKSCDLEAGRSAHLPQGFHVLTGHGQDHRQRSEALNNDQFRVTVVPDVGDPAIAKSFTTIGVSS